MLAKMQRNQNTPTLLMGMKNVAATVENRQFFKKLQIELPYDPEFPLLVTQPRKIKTLFYKNTCT